MIGSKKSHATFDYLGNTQTKSVKVRLPKDKQSSF